MSLQSQSPYNAVTDPVGHNAQHNVTDGQTDRHGDIMLPRAERSARSTID